MITTITRRRIALMKLPSPYTFHLKTTSTRRLTTVSCYSSPRRRCESISSRWNNHDNLRSNKQIACKFATKKTASSSLPTIDTTTSPINNGKLNINGTIPSNGKGIEIGHYAMLQRSFTQNDIDTYSKLIGDYNPIHQTLDWEIAKNDLPFIDDLIDANITVTTKEEVDINDDESIHEKNQSQSKQTPTKTRPVVHGMLLSSLFSTIFATIAPGCVYINQSLDFVKPVIVNELVTAKLTITRIRTWPKRFNRGGIIVTCDTQILLGDNDDRNNNQDHYTLVDANNNDTNVSDDNQDNSNEQQDQQQQQNQDKVEVVAVRGKANVWLPGGHQLKIE